MAGFFKMARASGEAATAVAHLGVVAVFALDGKVVGVGYLGGFNHLLHGGILHAEGYVVEETIVEEDGLLVYISDKGAEVGHVHIFYIHTVHQNLPASHVVVARKEVDERTLARTALANEGNGLAALHGEVYIVEHFLAAAVAERYVPKFYLRLQVLHVGGILTFANRIGGIQNLIDALHRSHTFGNGVRGF